MSVTVAKDLLYGWFFGFIVPKSIIYPVFRGMWRAMKATDRLDEQERLGVVSDDGGGQVVRRWPRRRPPRDGSPRGARRERVHH